MIELFEEPLLEGRMIGLVVLKAAEAEGTPGGDVGGQVVDVTSGGWIEVVGGDGILIDGRMRLDGTDFIREHCCMEQVKFGKGLEDPRAMNRVGVGKKERELN